MDIDEIKQALLKETSVITNRSISELDPEESLVRNGINSMGFMELLIAVKRLYGVDLAEAGLGAGDVASISALAKRIAEGEVK